MPTTTTTIRRTTNPWRARITGLGYALTLLVLIVGIPAALWAIRGNPLPTSIPSWQQAKDALLRPDDGHLFLSALIIIAWVAWATFALPVVVELAARVRGLPAPHLPGLHWQQRGAAGLLAGAALLFTAGQAGAVTLPHHLTPAPATTISTTQQGATTAADTPAATPTPAAVPATVAYTVQQGDTPWGIAHAQLGDGARYTEITHPDGTALDPGRWLQPGQTLALPAPPATAAVDGTVTVHDGDTLSGIAAAHHLPVEEVITTNLGSPQPGGQHLTDPDHITPGWTITLPAAAAPATPVAPPAAPATPPPAANPAPPVATPDAAAQAQQAAAQAAQRAQQQPAAQQRAATTPPTPTADNAGDQFPIRTVGGVGAILAAGVLGLLAARRRNQQRHRNPGTRIPIPTGDVADTEHELRATASPLDITTVDLALRTLAHTCHHTNQPLPHVRAARLTAEQFELYLATPADLPAPWTGTSDRAVWMLPNDLDEDELISPEQAADVPAPYPSLVTLGHDPEDGHVFLDLEEVTALGITGDPDRTRAVITALVLELATSCWADDLQVTVVGACADLETSMQTGRIRYLPDADSVLADLNRRADGDRTILTECDTPDLQHARVRNTAPGIWTPEIVLIADPLTAGQRTRLTTALEEFPRVAVAAITSGDPVGEWALTLHDEDDTAVLAPIGLTLRPQMVDTTTYAHLVDVMGAANVADTGDAATEPALADLPAATTDDTVQEQTGDENSTPGVEEPQTQDGPATDPAGEMELSAAGDAAPPEQGIETDADGAEPETGDEHHTTTAAETAPPAAEANEPADVEPPADNETTPAGVVRQLHPDAPRILLLGPPEIVGARGEVASNMRNRTIELAAYLALHPGVDYTAIDTAMSPGRVVSNNTRNRNVSVLRRLLGTAPDGQDYLPRHTAGSGYYLLDPVTTDWQQWCNLLPTGADGAPTEHLDQALHLVRGRPFADVKPRTYAWGETVMQEMIASIVDAAHELGRRRLLEGRWRDATHAAVTGLSVEPGMERLWRIRILAERAAGNTTAADDAVNRLLLITDELGGDLEDATEQLLADLAAQPTLDRDQLVAHAH